MIILKVILYLTILLLLPAYSYSAILDALHVSLIDGDVQIKTEDTSDWVPASINMPLMSGDSLWVPEGGRVELQTKYGSYLRLDKNSSLDILRIENDSSQFYLPFGRAYINFSGLKGRLLQIDTPLSSVRVYNSSIFKIDVFEDGNTEISVLKGIVYADSRSGRTTVNAGKGLSIGEDNYAELSPLGSSDEWEEWNRDRDRELYEKRYSIRYLPDGLGVYSYDFDRYGKWVYVREYGYCWSPTVLVSAGWAPYRIGRWVWIAGDYVWVSYEPWGWSPYHYGRWAYIASIGWCWVPPLRGAVYWAPGFVGWVYTPTYVAWVPLAPRDIYYGYGYFGPFSVNIINVNINKIVVKKVFKNVFVSDAVSISSRETFITGRPAKVITKKNPFLAERISIGRPLIKPQRTTMIPVIKEIPVVKHPPKFVRDTRIEELKHRRPLVRNPNVPVLTPQLPQKTMPLRIFNKPRGAESRTFSEKESVPLKRMPLPERQVRPKKETKRQGLKGLPEKRKPEKVFPLEKFPAQPERKMQPPERRPVPFERQTVPSERRMQTPERPKGGIEQKGIERKSKEPKEQKKGQRKKEDEGKF
ncbi:MAG: DUF6600 domain-containing protein [Nitrospirota bacterium]